jgi:hypothetical protein
MTSKLNMHDTAPETLAHMPDWVTSGYSQLDDTDTTDEGLQILQYSLCNAGRHRSHPHDPQTTISDVGPIRIQAICGFRWITVSSQLHESAVHQNLRQNRAKTASGISSGVSVSVPWVRMRVYSDVIVTSSQLEHHVQHAIA